MDLLPDTQNWGLRMRRECHERFSRHRLQSKPLVSDPGMHHGTCVTHMLWCMSGLLTSGSGKNDPGIPGACAIRNFTYLVSGPWPQTFNTYAASCTSLKAILYQQCRANFSTGWNTKYRIFRTFHNLAEHPMTRLSWRRDDSSSVPANYDILIGIVQYPER